MKGDLSQSSLTGGRLLARNTVWNLAGMLLPTLAGVVAIPRLVHSLGVDCFGLLSLAWIIVGYFSLFDMGMGRALTKLIADKLGANEERSIPPLVWTSLLLLLLLGVTAAAVLLSISPWLLHHVLKIPSALQPESLQSFEWLAASIPIVTVTSGTARRPGGTAALSNPESHSYANEHLPVPRAAVSVAVLSSPGSCDRRFGGRKARRRRCSI